MARSMFSVGTEKLFAFSTAEASVMLAAMSPLPPSRTATSTARSSFAYWFDRFASFAAFFRLMVAHLECPDISVPPDVSELREQVTVQPALADQLRMER
jgi:hypothetical protein